ncbi:MAG: methylated-DNA--[protein]-cysteine S-methyltransferase, partial [Actinomycetota bacterium]
MKTIEEALARASRAPVADAPDRAVARFVARAGKAGLVDVAYAPVDSPFGELIVAATPKGLVRIELAPARTDLVLEQLAETISPRVLEDPRRVDDVRRQLDEYFAGKRHTFEL